MSKKTESNYSATITESSRELTARERIMYKDTQNAVSLLDMATEATVQGSKAIITNVKDFIKVNIHNEKSEDKDYMNFIVVDGDGEKYVTGSQSFVNAFMDIYEEMKGETEPWGIQLNLLDSKNYKGKHILTCSLI